MKFQEAFDKAFDINQKISKQCGGVLMVSPRTARTLAFFWNTLKAADFVLDDFAVISENNEIVSIDEKPIVTKKDKKAKAVDDDGGSGEE